MWFCRGFKPAVCWVFLVSAIGFIQTALSAQLAISEAKGSVIGVMIELNAEEKKWMAENPQIIVASTQYPLYLFKDEHGQWSGLNNDLLNRIGEMTGLQFIHEESFSTAQLLERLESGAADMSTTLAMNDERKTLSLIHI